MFVWPRVNRSFFCLQKILLLVALICITQFAQARKETREYFKVWPTVTINGDITPDKKWKLYAATQLRFIDRSNYFETANTQLGIGYQILPQISLWVGGQRFTANQVFDVYGESRLWEQILFTLIKNKSVELITFSRVDMRDRQNEDEWSYRLRQRIAVKFYKLIFHRNNLVIADDIYLHLNTPHWVNGYTFDQNRLYIGIEFPINKNVALECDYLNQHIFRRTHNEIANAIYSSLNISF